MLDGRKGDVQKGALTKQEIGLKTESSYRVLPIPDYVFEEILKEKEKITIEVLDEGLLDELNMLNRKIEELSLKKGEIQQSIHLLEEQEQIRQNLNRELYEIEKQMNNEKTEDKIKRFNQIFSDYCQKL